MSSQLVERQTAIPSTLTTGVEGRVHDPNLRLDRHTTQLSLCTDNGEVTTFVTSGDYELWHSFGCSRGHLPGRQQAWR